MAENAAKKQGWFEQEKNWRMLCHLSSLAGFIFPHGNIFGPLAVWLIKKDQIPFVDDQAKESLNFQINLTIYALAAGLLCIVLIGIPILIGVFIFGIIHVVRAIDQAQKGEKYRYPLTIRFIK